MKKLVAIVACGVLFVLAAGCARVVKKDSTAFFEQVGEPVRVSPENADAAESAVAVANDGTIYVSWVEHRARKEADVFVLRLDGDGRATGEPVRVNTREGEATAWRGDPPTLAVSSDGQLYVGWTARAASEGHATDLYLSASRDGGRTFASPVRVNDDRLPVVHGMHSLAVARDGRIHLAWLDERNIGPPAGKKADPKQMEHMERNREVFTAFSVDGGRSFSANRRVAVEACPCCKTSVAAAPDGRVYVGWRQVLPGDYRHIAVSASADGGESYGPPLIVSDDQWVIAGCPVSGPALSITGDGVLRVMWYTAGERGTPGLYWAESRAPGLTFSESRLFAGGQAHGTPFLLADERGRLTVVWEGMDDGGASRLMAAPLGTGGSKDSAPVLSGGAELPSAAMARDRLLISYIVNTNERRSIWVLRAKTVAAETGDRAVAADAVGTTWKFPASSISWPR
ncbi:MAG TPA: sialidase family protein [Pyrinomonadaceae bacterium]|nr:sialidase family protein [Pyrinomonadaceae bacterium]